MKFNTALLFCFYLSMTTSFSHAKLSDWHEYSSENFKIYSDEKPAKVKKTLTDFEKFRAATLHFSGLKNHPENSRMIILLYADRSEYLKLNPEKSVGGFYMSSWAGPRMVVGPGVRSLDSSAILFHEYVHHLMREHTNLIYPKWYEEGLAELLGSATVKDNDVIVSSLTPLRRGWLEHEEILPVRYLLTPKNAESGSNYWGRFYAASWIFTHYLHMGHLDGKPDYRQASRHLIMRIHKGDDAETAFTEEFGMPTRSMDKELLRYMKRGSFIAVKLSVGKYKGEINTRKLPSNEIRYILSDMAAQRGEEETALGYLQGIDATQADSARALAQLAVLQNHELLPSAEAHLRNALQSMLTAPISHLTISSAPTCTKAQANI